MSFLQFFNSWVNSSVGAFDYILDDRIFSFFSTVPGIFPFVSLLTLSFVLYMVRRFFGG